MIPEMHTISNGDFIFQQDVAISQIFACIIALLGQLSSEKDAGRLLKQRERGYIVHVRLFVCLNVKCFFLSFIYNYPTTMNVI